MQFSKLVEDIERIKTGPIPPLDHPILDEVENAPEWVQVTVSNAIASPTVPPRYYWHPATGQLSWTAPTALPDVSKSLEMTRAVITDAVERLQNAASAELPHVPLHVQKVIQASTLLNLLNSLAKEQENSNSDSGGVPSKQMWNSASSVWCTVHASIAAAVAELSIPEEEARVKTEGAAVKVKEEEAEELERNDDDMEIEDDDEGEVNIMHLKGVEAGVAGVMARKKKLKTIGTAAGRQMTPPLSNTATASGEKILLKKAKIKSSSRLVGKGTSAMMNKWASVQKELKEDLANNVGSDEEEEFFDGDAEALAAHKEKKRLRQAEEWRTEQIRSGAVDANPNFAPVMGNWRERVKKTSNEPPVGTHSHETEKVKELQKEGQDSDSAPANIPDLDALSVGLPYGWRAVWDASRDAVYYGNSETQATQWERP